jgi:hypothetical protein
MTDTLLQNLADLFILKPPGTTANTYFSWKDENDNVYMISHFVKPASSLSLSVRQDVPLIKKTTDNINDYENIKQQLMTLFIAKTRCVVKNEQYKWLDTNDNYNEVFYMLGTTEQCNENMTNMTELSNLYYTTEFWAALILFILLYIIFMH